MTEEKRRMVTASLFFLFSLIFPLYCCAENNLDTDGGEKRMLKGALVYFGHQSVGGNILAGMEEMGATDIEEYNGAQSLESGIIHKYIGRNGYPSEKIEDFQNTVLNWQWDRSPDAAVMKFCYADINEHTDVSAVFEQYLSMVRILEKERPDLKILHMTIPLETHDRTFKGFLKKVLGRPSYIYLYNLRREQYNELIREEYGPSGSLFDLAEYESTLPDGRRAEFSNSRGRGYVLYSEYASDTGHLNRYGREVMALEFKRFLESIEE